MALAAAKIQCGSLSVEDYARSLLSRIKERDDTVRAWAYINEDLVLEQARQLDQVPLGKRGPLHGVAVAVKDVIYTKDMPTQHNSPIYEGNLAGIDAGSVMILRQAGALILGKTTTTEFAATVDGPSTRNPHDPTRTPGGSSSGSGAAVADMQAAVGLGTQTGGSTIRPGSYNGIFAFKPTWNSITREGQKVFSLILDTLGLYARSVEDLELLADAFGLQDDEPPFAATEGRFVVKGAKLALMKTVVWQDNVEPSTEAAMRKAAELLRSHGAEVEEVELPDDLKELPKWHQVVFKEDGRTAFLPEHRASRDQLHTQLVGHVENVHRLTHAQHVESFDSIAAARPRVDALLSRIRGFSIDMDGRLTHPDAPENGKTNGSGSLLQALHVPIVNLPGFAGENGLPVGISIVAPRYHDRRLLAICREVGRIFEEEGGWRSQL
ncbi:hypothetical protein SLS53_009372 [Cytospora paraplurivora]|uniref:Amidase domain-containing protein n=1 Tax=Cytospora paraplurivora TaxID=2898453 RepID=A0AAN9YB10_9PEZI